VVQVEVLVTVGQAEIADTDGVLGFAVAAEAAEAIHHATEAVHFTAQGRERKRPGAADRTGSEPGRSCNHGLENDV
jgi:hypothetical protein